MRHLEQVAVLLFEFLDDVAHFLRAGAVGDQQRVRGIHHHQVVHARSARLACLRRPRSCRSSIAPELRPGRHCRFHRAPAARKPRSSFRRRSSRNRRWRSQQHAAISRAQRSRWRCSRSAGTPPSVWRRSGDWKIRAGWRAASRSWADIRAAQSSSTEVFQKNMPAFQ